MFLQTQRCVKFTKHWSAGSRLSLRSMPSYRTNFTPARHISSSSDNILSILMYEKYLPNLPAKEKENLHKILSQNLSTEEKFDKLIVELSKFRGDRSNKSLGFLDAVSLHQKKTEELQKLGVNYPTTEQFKTLFELEFRRMERKFGPLPPANTPQYADYVKKLQEYQASADLFDRFAFSDFNEFIKEATEIAEEERSSIIAPGTQLLAYRILKLLEEY